MKILFIGDIVGKVGRRMVKDKLSYFVDKYKIDFVIANGENASHGLGLQENHYEELINYGIDCITLGNHYNSKKQLSHFIEFKDGLVRPINLINEYSGEGSVEYDVDGIGVRVTNVLGSLLMKEQVVVPSLALYDVLETNESLIHIVDFHGEATGEKQVFGNEFDGKVSAILGTHTHVQTRDYKILPKGTAYISDVGMCGYADGVIGFKDGKCPDEGRGIFSAVVLDIDNISGLCNEIFPIYYEEERQ